MGGIARTLRVARMAAAAGLPCTPHSANLSLVTICRCFSSPSLGIRPGTFTGGPYSSTSGCRYWFCIRFFIFPASS